MDCVINSPEYNLLRLLFLWKSGPYGSSIAKDCRPCVKQTSNLKTSKSFGMIIIEAFQGELESELCRVDDLLLSTTNYSVWKRVLRLLFRGLKCWRCVQLFYTSYPSFASIF